MKWVHILSRVKPQFKYYETLNWSSEHEGTQSFNHNPQHIYKLNFTFRKGQYTFEALPQTLTSLIAKTGALLKPITIKRKYAAVITIDDQVRKGQSGAGQVETVRRPEQGVFDERDSRIELN